MIAAYAGSGPVPRLSSASPGAGKGAVIISPALASGPVSSCSATRAMIEPSPSSDWCTSCTAKKRGGPNSLASVELPLPARTASRTVRPIVSATQTQVLRSERSLVHSARSTCANPAPWLVTVES